MASFTTVNQTLELFVPDKGETIAVAISGTYDQVIDLQLELGSKGSGAWQTVKQFSTEDATEAFDYITKSVGENLRLLLRTDDGGDATVTLTDSSDKVIKTIKDAVGNVLASFRQSGPLFSGITVFEKATNALVLGTGKSGVHLALGSAAGSALEFRFTGTNTTGDMRGMYLRLNFEGVGGSGEAARIFAILNNVTGATGGTINGAHISLAVNGASGSIAGAGNAIRATIGFDSAFAGGGTMSGILLDADIHTSANISSVNLAALRLSRAGTKKWPVFAAFDATVGSGEAIETSANAMTTNATSHAIHVTIDGVSGFIPVFDTNNWS